MSDQKNQIRKNGIHNGNKKTNKKMQGHLFTANFIPDQILADTTNICMNAASFR